MSSRYADKKALVTGGTGSFGHTVTKKLLSRGVDETGAVITAGVEPHGILDAISVTLDSFGRDGRPGIPAEYTISDSSRRIVNFIRSTAHGHHVRSGIRGGSAG